MSSRTLFPTKKLLKHKLKNTSTLSTSQKLYLINNCASETLQITLNKNFHKIINEFESELKISAFKYLKLYNENELKNVHSNLNSKQVFNLSDDSEMEQSVVNFISQGQNFTPPLRHTSFSAELQFNNDLISVVQTVHKHFTGKPIINLSKENFNHK